MNANIDLSNVILKTKRLILRPFTFDDLDDFYEYAKVPGIGEIAGWHHHQNNGESLFILNMFINEKKTFAIEYEGKVIGSLGIEVYDEKLFPDLENKLGRSLGFVLSKDYWGLGLMPEAVKEVIRYCFDDLKLDFLVGGFFSFNNQSKRVFEKCGFEYQMTITKEVLSETRETIMVALFNK